MKTVMSGMQNTLDMINGKLDIEETNELAGVVVETIHNETERKIFSFRERNIFLSKSGESKRELWNNFT